MIAFRVGHQALCLRSMLAMLLHFDMHPGIFEVVECDPDLGSTLVSGPGDFVQSTPL
jgi:hypothetical protein